MAGGKGTRMRCSSVHKVCFPLGGKPVINRTIETLDRCGISSHFIVIRHLAEQVMQAVASAPGTHYFCYQIEPRGTGNAAKTAAAIMETIPSIDDVLVIAGDKVIEEPVLKKLIERFYETGSDLTFIAGKVEDFPGSGRIIETEQGAVQGIIELPDIKKSLADNSFNMVLNGRKITPEVISNVRHVNLSVYLFRKDAFLSSIRNLSDNNVQKEEYLTDAIGILAASGAKITVLPVENHHQVMAFNTPEEMMEIERHLAEKNPAFVKESPSAVRRPLDWLRHLETASPRSLEYFRGVYGDGYPGIEKKRLMIIAALKEYLNQFGNTPVVITRAPGRINLMGRHIDHQGGDVNMMALDKDIYCIAGQRTDRQVFARSVEPVRFPDRHFSIDQLRIDMNSDWHAFIDSSHVKATENLTRGDWGQYVRAVIARFQHFCGTNRLNGMNIMTSSDLPAGGGISSSSALFVSIAEACVSLNNLEISGERFVELCGEGERYVGTRGGSGDHAAIKYSRRGAITQIGFSPVRKIRTVRFPEGCVLAICNSRHHAHKTRGAKNIYNQRVACYLAGMEILKKRFPDDMNSVAYLRDIVYGKALQEKMIFSMLLDLPLGAAIREVLEAGVSEELRMRLEEMPDNLSKLPVREVFVYGLAECLRSRLVTGLLLEGSMAEFGGWMNISHDGDRVVRWTGPDSSATFHPDYSDSSIRDLIRRAGSSAKNSLLLQSGSYRCSIPEIDKMVDISLSVKGAYGAQISGAGLGGCMMVALEESAYENLNEKLRTEYYEPLNLEPQVFISFPSEGSGPVCF